MDEFCGLIADGKGERVEGEILRKILVLFYFNQLKMLRNVAQDPILYISATLQSE